MRDTVHGKVSKSVVELKKSRHRVVYSAFANSCPMQTDIFFQLFIATMLISLQTSVMIDLPHKNQPLGTSSKVIVKVLKHAFFYNSVEQIYLSYYRISTVIYHLV